MDVFKLLGKVVLDGMDEAKKELDGLSGKAESSESRLTGAFKKIGGAVITYFATDKIIDFGKACVDLSATVAAEESAFEQIMGGYADSATEKMGEVAYATGMVDSRLTPYMTSMTAKFKGLGYDIDDATSYAQDGLLLAADAAAFWDKSLDESMSHLNSFVNGSYEGGEAIGLFANDTQMAAYAVEKGLVSETKEWAKLEEKIKQATRLEYAQNMMKQSGAVGQAAKESGQYANQMANLSEKWRQVKADIGEPILEKFVLPGVERLSSFLDENIEPALDFFTDKVIPVIETIGKSAEEYIMPILSDAGEKFMPLIETSLETVGELVETLFPVIENIYNFLEPALSFIMDIITDIVELLPVAVDFLLDIVDPLNLIHEETINLTDAQKDLIDKNKELAESLEEVSKKTEDEVKQIDNEYKHYDSLLGQLDNLVDKNGKVKTGYEDRATAILTTLSEATGVEFEIIDGEIQKYDELKGSIEDVITQMRTKAKLQAYEAEYNEAVAGEEAARTQYEDLSKEYEVNSNLLQSLYDGLEKLESGAVSYNDLQAMSNRTFDWDNEFSKKDAIHYAIERYKNEIAELEPVVETLGDEYMKAGQTFSDITAIMENYELASSDSSEETLLLLETHFKKAEQMTEEQAKEQVETIEQMYDDYEKEVKKGTPGYTKAHLDGIGNLRTQARIEYSKYNGDVNSLMNDIVNTVEGKNAALGESGRNGADLWGNNFLDGLHSNFGNIINTVDSYISYLNGLGGSSSVYVNSPSDAALVVEKLNLAGHAKGGIVTREHIARVGEDGAEAIIPLEKNTEWIDKVAARMSGSV
ncbi:MAG: hypothetical protein E7508_07690, partial [Ruminococcus sp.]|nr:hypothetical protein [Ruminococcus sp.]